MAHEDHDMTKLKMWTTVLATVACAAMLVTGCKGKPGKDEASGATPVAAQKVADDRGSAAKGNLGSGSGSTTTAPVTPANPGGMPAECNDYKAAIDKLAQCDKLDAATRDALKQAYAQVSAGWPSVPAEAKPGVAATCKTALEAVDKAAKSTCGW
jgi:hypothetical protein